MDIHKIIADANRYRWLRDRSENVIIDIVSSRTWNSVKNYKKQLDALIDQELSMATPECLQMAEVITEKQIECTPIPPVTKNGWTEWQFPLHKGYLMQCCDCNLVHEINFKVVEKVSNVKKDGSWESEPTKSGKFRVGMRMRRKKNVTSTV